MNYKPSKFLESIKKEHKTNQTQKGADQNAAQRKGTCRINNPFEAQRRKSGAPGGCKKKNKTLALCGFISSRSHEHPSV
ncbi:hypothetical protein V6Z12_A12G121300 [Gossypium hirsutum]